MKIIFTRGIMGSGKSTWAKQYVQDHKDYVRICRDDLRNMRGTYWLPKQEDMISSWENALILEALDRGHNVIIDAMNLNTKHVTKLQNLIADYCSTHTLFFPKFEFKDFTDVPLDVCIKRDLQRPNSIGEKMIRQTYNKYLAPKVEPYKYDGSLPNAIIVDLDGTLALFGDKNPYERDFINDDLNNAVVGVLDAYNQHSLYGRVFIFSGRSERFREETESWLSKHEIEYSLLEMRTIEEEKAQIKDTVVKKRMFDTFVRGKYNIDFVLDDRNCVVALWRSLGLTCFQVNDGDF